MTKALSVLLPCFDAVLLSWRESAGRASRLDPAFAGARFDDVKQHYVQESFLEHGREVVLWGAGPVGKKWARRLVTQGFLVRYFVELDPRKIGQKIHGAEVISNEDLTPLAGRSVIVAVGALSRERTDASPWRGAREEIRSQLRANGFEELRDFVCVA